MRTPIIFRHFRTIRDEGEPTIDSAAWVGPSMPETWTPYDDSIDKGRFLVGWIDVESLRWVDRTSIGRFMEAVVTARIFDGETP